MRGADNLRAKTWNALKLTGPWGVDPALGAADPELNRIRVYAGGVRSDYRTWPEPYQSAAAGNPNITNWDGVTRPDIVRSG